MTGGQPRKWNGGAEEGSWEVQHPLGTSLWHVATNWAAYHTEEILLACLFTSAVCIEPYPSIKRMHVLSASHVGDAVCSTGLYSCPIHGDVCGLERKLIKLSFSKGLCCGLSIAARARACFVLLGKAEEIMCVFLYKRDARSRLKNVWLIPSA